MTKHFFELLEIGKKKELEAQKLMFQLHKLTVIETRNDDKFDFRTSDNVTYEVKFDERSITTNNFFIEFKTIYEDNSGRPIKINSSGISKTEADNYILVNSPNDSTILFYIVSVKILKENIANNNYKKIYCNKINKHILSWGYLIPINEIMKISDIYIKTSDIYTQIKN